MIRLVQIELLKLRTSPALFVSFLSAVSLSVLSVVTIMQTAGSAAADPFGSRAQVAHVLNQPSAVVTMTMFALGVLIVAGEYRHRTIIGTFLAESRRLRVLVAKLVVAAGLGALAGALCYGVTLATALPLYAHRGVHQLPVDVWSIGTGTVLGGACYALLGVALGALTRNTVGAVVGGLVWIQLIEVGVLENAAPSLAKWLPAGAAQALTQFEQSGNTLGRYTAALVLAAWVAALVALAGRVSLRREVR
jgi:ABC-2 type transport system permease protein